MKGLILLDVFSYSCMNCLRSLEFIKRIDKKYRKFGLKTIIIHPSEWNFEKKRKNVSFASKKYSVKFPIRLDKNYKIIKKLGINFWPAQLLMKDGKIAYKHIGEGNYKNLEKNIAKLLKIRSKNAFTKEPKYSKFPAVYCGKRKHGKMIRLNDSKAKMRFGKIYVNDRWLQKNEFLQSLGNNAELSIITKGRVTNFVAESMRKKPVKIRIQQGSKKIKFIAITMPRLYKLVNSKKNKNNKLTIIADKNLAIYSFSFQ